MGTIGDALAGAQSGAQRLGGGPTAYKAAQDGKARHHERTSAPTPTAQGGAPCQPAPGHASRGRAVAQSLGQNGYICLTGLPKSGILGVSRVGLTSWCWRTRGRSALLD